MVLYPLHISKKKFVSNLFSKISRDRSIIAANCGEGVSWKNSAAAGFAKGRGTAVPNLARLVISDSSRL